MQRPFFLRKGFAASVLGLISIGLLWASSSCRKGSAAGRMPPRPLCAAFSSPPVPRTLCSWSFSCFHYYFLW